MNGLKIISATDKLPLKYGVITLFGQPGIGKTSLAFTMPKPVLFLDFDEGLHRASMKCRPHSSIKVENPTQFVDTVESDGFATFVKDEGFKSVIIDTAGTFLDDVLAEYVKRIDHKNSNSTGGLSLSGWGAVKDVFNRIRNRFQRLGLHIAIVSHDKDLGDESPVKMGLAISGGSSDIVQRVSDQIGFVFMQGNKRMIEFSPSQKHIGKDTAQIGKVQVPDDTSADYDDFLAGIIQKCHQRVVDANNAQKEVHAKIDEYQLGLEQCTEPEHFAEMGEMIKKESGAVLIALRGMMKKQMEVAGVVWDKTAKTYVAKETAS